jgi:hypothetical protein
MDKQLMANWHKIGGIPATLITHSLGTFYNKTDEAGLSTNQI